MKTLTAALSLLLVGLLAAACSSNSGVGGGCTQSSDCTQGFQTGDTSFPPVCIQQMKTDGGPTSTPGGYCSASCLTRGSTVGCPSGTVCDIFPTGASTLYCLAECKTQSDCRSGFNCNGITGSTLKACQ